jgi:hypothetical protein
MTVLSSSIVKNLGDKAYTPGLLYFYFDFQNRDKQSLEGAIKSLMSQLYSKQEKARQPLDSLYSSYNDGHRQPNTESLCSTFLAMLQQVEETWIVLDALDECSEQEGS